MDVEKLQTAKYQDLQKLAKKHGIKANMKIDKLRKALKDYFEKNSDQIPIEKSTLKSPKPSTPAQKTQKNTSKLVPKVATPVPKFVKNSATVKPSPRPSTPVVVQRVLEKSNTPRIGSPLASKLTPAKTTPTIVKPVHTPKGTPNSAKTTPKIVKPVHTPKGTSNSAKTTPTIVKPVHTPKGTPNLQKPSASSPAVKSKTAKVTKINTIKEAVKRKHSETATPESNNGDGRKAKRRRSTFEFATPVEGNTPQTNQDSADSQKRKRRSTFEVTPDIKTDSVAKENKEVTGSNKSKPAKKNKIISPGVQAMITSMDVDQGDDEIKNTLLSAIDKKVKTAQSNEVGTDKKVPVTQIPRFAAFLAKKREEEANKKNITPGNKDWSKIHKKNFEKMESIEDYLNKRKQQREDVTASVKKARMILEDTKAAVNKLKNYKTPVNDNGKAKSLFRTPSEVSANKFKPTVLSTKNMDLNFSKRKSPRTSSSAVKQPFKPTVLSTSNMNLNFGSMKTPQTVPRKNSLPNGKLSVGKSVGSSVPRKSTGVTPFRFNATLNNTLNETKSVKKFDLKASLSRPVTWKMHAGKLKPVEKIPAYIGATGTENKKEVTKSPIQKNRDNRRAAANKQRKDKKWQKQMTKRGITNA